MARGTMTPMLVCAFTSIGFLACGVSGCSEPSHGAALDASTGTLEWALTAYGGSGIEYRLRAAQIDLVGPESQSVDVGTAAEMIRIELQPGNYDATLMEGWRMQRRGVDGTFEPVKAKLTSPQPLAIAVEEDEVTELALEFDVGNDVISFGKGALEISLIVNEIDAGAEPTEWTRQFGSSGWDVVHELSADANRGIYVAGTVGLDLPGQTSAGEEDALVAKYDRSGELEWALQFGTAVDDYGQTSAVDAGGSVFVAGGTWGAFPGQTSSGGVDVFLAKHDEDGAPQWVTQFGSTGFDYASGCSADADGNVYTAGTTYGALSGQSASGDADAFLTKHDGDGTLLWTRQFGSTSLDLNMGVAVDVNGNVYVCGRTTGALLGQASFGGEDAFLAKYSSSGTLQWTRQFGTSSSDMATGLGVDGHGNVYVGGETWGTFAGQSNSGASDGFVAKFNTSGTQQWARQFGTGDSEGVFASTVDGSGNAWVSGRTNGSFDGQQRAADTDGFVAMYDSVGAFQLARQFGTTGEEGAYGLSVDEDGAVYVGGDTTGTFPGQTNFGGGADAYVMKLLP
jgi:hypothetical protein